MTGPTPDLDKAALHAAEMLAALGLAGDDRTPTRLVRALHELARHRDDDPRRHLAVRFPPIHTGPADLVVVSDVPFVSLCEHHMLPFAGHATVAYLPGSSHPIVGLSKLARVVQEYAARPQVQERLTHQICDAVNGELRPLGAACAVRGVHSCMSLRGARTGPTAAMITTAHRGQLTDSPWREEFAARLNTAPWRQS